MRMPATIIVAAIALLFISLWSALTLGFDYKILQGIAQQLRTLSFEETQGEILQSTVNSHRGSKSTTYSLEVSYSYQVEGKKYFGNQYRNGSMSSNDSSASRISAKFNAQPLVPVYFNPVIPAEAVLVRGIEGVDLFTLLFITPFNMVMLVAWWGVCIWLRRKYRKPEAGGVKFFDRGSQTILKVHYNSPITAAMATLGFCSFIAVFLIVIPCGSHPPLWLMLFVWTVILLLAGYTTFHAWRTNQSGIHDFIIDDFQQTVSFCPLPAPKDLTTHTIKQILNAKQFSQRISLQRSEIQNISIQSREKRDSDGDVTTIFLPTIMWEQQSALLETTDKEYAEEFVTWLRRRIGVMTQVR